MSKPMTLMEQYNALNTDVPITNAYVIEKDDGQGEAVFIFPHFLTDHRVYVALACNALRNWFDGHTLEPKHILFRTHRVNPEDQTITVTVFYEPTNESN